MVTMRGSGCRVLAPPSMAIPRVLVFFITRTRVEGTSRETTDPLCRPQPEGQREKRRERERERERYSEIFSHSTFFQPYICNILGTIIIFHVLFSYILEPVLRISAVWVETSTTMQASCVDSNLI